MRIGFDLTSGAILQELELPENTTLLIAPGLLSVPNRGELHCELVDDTITKGELKVLVAPEELQRMADAEAAGITDAGELENNVLVEVTFALNVERLGEHVSKFANVDEPLDLLFVHDGTFPILLNLQYYDVVSIMQETQSVEAAVELSKESE